VLDDLARRQRNDRLRVEDESIVVDGVTDALDPRDVLHVALARFLALLLLADVDDLDEQGCGDPVGVTQRYG
jgi:hypothetical protein